MFLPSDFTTRMSLWMGDYALLETALQQEAPVSIRLHPDKGATAQPRYEKVPWCDTGYYLPERPAFTFDPLFHAGAYYVQEAASMFLEQAVKQYVSSPCLCLDLCAAPGGKATHLLRLLPDGSLLVANEVVRSRCAVLAENTAKWGAPHVVVTNNGAEAFGRLGQVFDLVVVDAPCSGEGMFRKDVASREEWSVAGVHHCAARQRRILHDVWDALKPGGICIYSTCTFNREENEENIRYFAETLPAEVLPVSVGRDWGVSCGGDGTYPSYRFFPHKTRGEGFFLAVLRKTEGHEQRLRRKVKNRLPASRRPLGVEEWLTGKEPFHFDVKGTDVRAIPASCGEMYEWLAERLHIVSAGVQVGVLKGKEVLPSAALALSVAFRREAFPVVELSWPDAVGYLQKKALILPDDTPKGCVAVTYRHIPLGFVKHVGSRANNLYPQEWRILNQHLPERAPGVV
ncbi:MAG: rRNA cytosine-C5-methyltransferase [Tannerella sp.]|jgi:16S rRNA C967 or C1407 C5-methylase (RsmB/RsmF family)/NOL1/NOP2/fmu family ribosome biogenesis protein|nr:rRNA cytosine-C5-methyltransferase [Tannerella sp.]